ncbi:MAG: disulfide bond formation protein B [Thermoleophilia bacterium]|nr:disulfide bond formation protein B [Thermoleophilia bacterium]
MIDITDRTLAAMAIVAQGLIVLIIIALVAAAVSGRARAALAEPYAFLTRWGLALAWVVAAVATGGSLYFSEIANYTPCQLCWYQRICMYPLVVTLAVGAIARDRWAAWYSAVFPVFGTAIAAWHIYIELNPSAESAACRIGAPCSVKWIEEFGYVTIPVLAITGFVLIGLLVGIVMMGSRRRAGAGEAPVPAA